MMNIRKYTIIFFMAAGILAGSVALYSGINKVTPKLADNGVIFRTITDMTGRLVKIPDNPSKILSLSVMADDIIVKLGLVGRLAAIDQYGKIIPGVERAEVVGKGSALSIEKILELKADIAFIWWYQDDVAAMLDKYSIPVVRLKSCRLNNYSDTVTLIGRCLNVEKNAAAVIEKFNKQIKALPQVKTHDRPGVYLELYSPYKTAGKDSYANDLIEAAGGNNIAGNVSGVAVLSAEEIILKSPQTILYIDGFATGDEIASRPGFKTLPAVKQRRVYGINRKRLVAGVEPVEAVNEIRKIINQEKGN
ncbi:MAG: ABC transporter substrate-binding protein [Victivallaceae bacterium]